MFALQALVTIQGIFDAVNLPPARGHVWWNKHWSHIWQVFYPYPVAHLKRTHTRSLSQLKITRGYWLSYRFLHDKQKKKNHLPTKIVKRSWSKAEQGKGRQLWLQGLSAKKCKMGDWDTPTRKSVNIKNPRLKRHQVLPSETETP